MSSKNVVYIGSENYPLPYVDSNGDIALLSNDNTYVRLPVLFEGDAETIQDRVTGMLWRNLPTRGRLNSFLTDLRRRSDNIDSDKNINKAFKYRRRAKLTLGQPGSGKTYKSKALGKMVSSKGAIYVNCKDMDLKNLIVQTVLDTSNIDVEKNAIDARIKMYNKGDKTAISRVGIEMLKNLFGDAFTIDDIGHISLDWTAAKQNTSYTSFDHDREFVSLLQQFCIQEQIKFTQNINNVGFVEKDGKLIEALETGRPIILDEINRGKNQDFLLPYLDFLNGGYESMDIEAANGRVIHLTKDDIPDTFMLEAIGNMETLEMGIKEKMSQPLKDRFDIEYVEDYTPQDFTDMFCAYATGIPIAIIRDAFQISDDKQLIETCKILRTLGMTKEEKYSVPEDQKVYIENAPQFLEAAEIVGKTLYQLYQLKKECQNSSVCEDAKLRQHIKETPFSFRLIEDIFNRVLTYVPNTQDKIKKNPFLQYVYSVPTGSNTFDMRMQKQGEAIEVALKEVAKEIFSSENVSDRELAAPVLSYANSILVSNGVGEENLTEARPIEQARLKNLFTFTVKSRVSEESLNIQNIICNIIKQEHPETESVSNDELINPVFIESFLKDIRENATESHKVFGKIFSVNLNGNLNNKTPFVETAVVETFGLVSDIKVQDLMEARAFLTTLAIDQLSENNMKTIWPKMFAINQQTTDNEFKEQYDILSGRSSEILYNSFVFRDETNNKIVLDIVHLPNKHQTLIVGEFLDEITKLRMKHKGITYIDRQEEFEARQNIDGWLSQNLSKDEQISLYKAIRLKHEVVGRSTEIDDVFLKPFEQRNSKNLAQVSVYLPSELSDEQYVNEDKNDTVNLDKDVYPVLNQLYKLNKDER